MILPHVGNHLGVTMCDEAMPTRSQLVPTFNVIEQFAVEDDGDGAVFVKDRLLSIGQANDAEPA